MVEGLLYLKELRFGIGLSILLEGCMGPQIKLLIELFGGPFKNYCSYYWDDFCYTTNCGVSILDILNIRIGIRCSFCGKLIRWVV
jgi:hypothetical protein